MARGFRRWVPVVAILGALTLLLAACGNDNNKATKAKSTTGAAKTYSIAFVGALTGDNANLGINIRNGAKVAVDAANKAGGARIKLREFDTQGDPAQASTLKEQFISDRTILGLVGPAFSGETKAVLPDLQQAGLVMISASATNAQLPTVVPNETVFHRVIPDDDVQGKGLSDYITQKLKAKTAAYVQDNSEYGKALAEGTAKLWEQAGVKTVVNDAVDPKSQDFSAAVNKVKAAKPDVIFYGGYYAEAGRLKKQLTDAGVKSTFVSGDGSLDPGFVSAAGASGDGAQITCPCNLATTDASGKLGDFAKRYKALNGKDAGTYSTEGYDAANILIKGIRAGNTTRSKLLDYVENLGTYDGISKSISFEANGNVKATGVFVFEVKGSKLSLLGTTEDLLKG